MSTQDEKSQYLETQQKPSEDLEKEIDRYEDEMHGFESASRDDCINIARHFAQWQKEQMMKGAVEGLIHRVGFHNAVYIREPEWTETLDKIKEGATVKIIIIKGDEK